MMRIKVAGIALIVILALIGTNVFAYAETNPVDSGETFTGFRSDSISCKALETQQAVLPAGQTMMLEAMPDNIKKGVGMSFVAVFDTFESITLGKGFGQYRGDWFVIEQSFVRWFHYETGEEVRQEREHGLNISEYLTVSMMVDDNSVCHLSMNSLGGSVILDFNWGFEQNYAPFAFGSQDMRECKLTAVVRDLGKPIWLFGDSYFGFGPGRVMGQLQNLGYADGCLICGIAGCGSENALQNNLRRLLKMGGRPEIVVWCLGMNDDCESYGNCLAEVIELGKQYGFETVLMTIPVVPERIENLTAINDMVLNSGCRYIDAKRAVGADDSGEWYPGYLDSDMIHPTEIGAKAIAARFLVDCPELLGQSYRPGNVNGGIIKVN